MEGMGIMDKGMNAFATVKDTVNEVKGE